MPDELREKTAYEYRKWNPSASIGRALEFADSVLSLIDAERCVWTLISNEMGSDFYRTSGYSVGGHAASCAAKRIATMIGGENV